MQFGMMDRHGLPPPAIDPKEHILVCIFGNFRLLRRGQPLKRVFSRKAVTLLSELALRLDLGVPREELLETLWPDQDSAHATVSLNSLVYSVQRQLKQDVPDAPAILYANGIYALNKEGGVSTDVAHFDAHIRQATWLAADSEDRGAADAYRRAVDLYRGDVSAGTNIHAVIERERLRASFLSALAWLAVWEFRNGNDITAMDYAVRLLASEPCREDAHRMVMRIHVRRGERAQALRQYQVCEQVLRAEFDVEPETLSRELYEQIRTGSTPT